MQDENTIQPTKASDNTADDSADTSGLKLSLGTNPTDQVQDTPADTPATDVSEETEETPEETTATQPSSDSSSGDLESIKSSALQELMPIVNELDQEPEDQYRTLMMLIQTSDNQALVKDAYAAAGKIEDKKAKAEALLNIVNEINYLTGKDKKSDS